MKVAQKRRGINLKLTKIQLKVARLDFLGATPLKFEH